MKKMIAFAALNIALGLAIGAGAAIAAAGAPAVQGIYGYFGGNPVYLVALEASSGLFVSGCPSGQTFTHMPMANGGHALLCK